MGASNSVSRDDILSRDAETSSDQSTKEISASELAAVLARVDGDAAPSLERPEGRISGARRIADRRPVEESDAFGDHEKPTTPNGLCVVTAPVEFSVAALPDAPVVTLKDVAPLEVARIEEETPVIVPLERSSRATIIALVMMVAVMVAAISFVATR